jgi:amino acid transporter
LGLGFQRLVELDVILYGSALLLEFVALVALRIREPNLPRPFRVPGGLPVAVLLGVGPAILLLLAIVHERQRNSGQFDAIVLGLALTLVGAVLYVVATWLRRRTIQVSGSSSHQDP